MFGCTADTTKLQGHPERISGLVGGRIAVVGSGLALVWVPWSQPGCRVEGGISLAERPVRRSLRNGSQLLSNGLGSPWQLFE